MEDDLDNPISAMTALKHPEIMEKAREHQYDDEMFGYDNGRHVYWCKIFVNKICKNYIDIFTN